MVAVTYEPGKQMTLIFISKKYFRKLGINLSYIKVPLIKKQTDTENDKKLLVIINPM